MYDVVALGELLIDFTPAGVSETGNVLFERNPGGAPANVLAAAAKLGCKTAFIGKVGKDNFGWFLKDVLENANIETKGLVFSDDTNTTLAFVHLKDNGDRSFSFYRNPGADMMLKEDEIDRNLVESTKVFHFGSISMTHEPVRSSTFEALAIAKEKNILISYDPNLRPPLWDCLERARNSMLEGMKYADILKISDEELQFLVGTSDFQEGSKILMDTYGISWIFVTMGAKGCYYRTRNHGGYRRGCSVKAIDTTGAGDTFLGAVLYQVVKENRELDDYSEEEMDRVVDFANAAGACVTVKRGAIPAMPALNDIEEMVRRSEKIQG